MIDVVVVKALQNGNIYYLSPNSLELKKGDNLVMLSGLCGKFCHFNGNKVVIEVDDHCRKLEFLKEYINIEKTIEINKPVIIENNQNNK